jgi:hypothetical protein
LGIVGAWFQKINNRHSFRYFFSVIILTTIIMVFVMNMSNAEVRDRDYFFVGRLQYLGLSGWVSVPLLWCALPKLSPPGWSSRL